MQIRMKSQNGQPEGTGCDSGRVGLGEEGRKRQTGKRHYMSRFPRSNFWEVNLEPQPIPGTQRATRWEPNGGAQGRLLVGDDDSFANVSDDDSLANVGDDDAFANVGDDDAFEFV